MDNKEFELQKRVIASGNFSQIMGLCRHFISALSFVGCIWLIMSGLSQIASHNPASLNALALVVEKLNISSWIGYAVAACTSTGWYIERKGKKRAYKKLGNRRAQQEKDDPYHPSSELDDDGHTPK